MSKYPCAYCDFSTDYKSNYNRHIKAKHEGTKHPKKEPNLLEPELQISHTSSQVNSVQTLTCTNCNCIFKNKKGLKKHIELDRCRGVAKTQCRHCKNVFASVQQRYKHEQRCKDKNKDPIDAVVE